MSLDLKKLRAYDYGEAFVQVSTTVTVTAKNDETLSELRSAIAAALPDFRYVGGLDRIRTGGPKPLGGEYDFDRQAHVCFRHHAPRRRKRRNIAAQAALTGEDTSTERTG